MTLLQKVEDVLNDAEPDIMNDHTVSVVDLLEDDGLDVYIDTVLIPHEGYICSVDGFDICIRR